MALDFEVIATKRETGEHWDIGDICEQIKITWELEGNAGTMETSYVEDKDVDLVEGDVVSLKLDGNYLFYGWVFKRTKSAYDSVKLKIYDIKRYLAYKDVDVTGNETLDELFVRICTMANINHRVIHKSSFIIPSKIHDGETYNNILQYAIDQTFIGSNERFCIRANGPVLELVCCDKQLTDLVLGDKSLVSDYEYSSDIENTYTAFKVQREVASESEKGKNKDDLSAAQKVLLRKTVTAELDENIKKWGVLQWYEKKDSKWTDAQLAQHLELLKSAYSKETKSLKLDCCFGDKECIPGNMVTLLLTDLEKEKVAQGTYALITSASHTISHNDWSMNLDVEVG